MESPTHFITGSPFRLPGSNTRHGVLLVINVSPIVVAKDCGRRPFGSLTARTEEKMHACQLLEELFSPGVET